MTDNPVKFSISFQDEDLNEVLSAAEDVGAADVEQVNRRGLSGIELVVIGAVAIPLFVNLLLKIVELWSCGVKVDGRTGELVTIKDCNLPRGSILVVTAEASQLFRPEEMSAPKLSDILKGLFE